MSLTWGSRPKLDTIRTRDGLQVLGKNEAVRLCLVLDRRTTGDRFVTKTDFRNLCRGFRNGFLIATPLWAALIYWLTR